MLKRIPEDEIAAMKEGGWEKLYEVRAKKEGLTKEEFIAKEEKRLGGKAPRGRNMLGI